MTISAPHDAVDQNVTAVWTLTDPDIVLAEIIAQSTLHLQDTDQE
jgi:hypothetical protein